MPLRAAALPAAALSTTFLLTSVIDQRGSLISDPRKISTVPFIQLRTSDFKCCSGISAKNDRDFITLSISMTAVC